MPSRNSAANPYAQCKADRPTEIDREKVLKKTDLIHGHIFTRHATYSPLGWSYSCVCREHDLTINTSPNNKEYSNTRKLSHRFAHDFTKASMVSLKGNGHAKWDASHRILLNPLNRFGLGEWEFKTGSWCSRVKADLPWLNEAEGDSDIVDVFRLVG